MVYLGHTHSRLEHSIGTSNHLKEILDLKSFYQGKLNKETKDQAVFAALCHDVGHGPFSHVFEYIVLPRIDRIYNFEHENFSIKIAERIFEDLKTPTFEFDGIEEIIKNGGKNLSNEIFNLVSNKRFGIDVDRLDYLLRDSFYSGIDLKINVDKIK